MLEDTLKAFMSGIYGTETQAEEIIESKGQLSAQDCLDIYRGSVRGGLTQALGDIYPAVKRCVGEKFFDAMAGRYINEYPSRSSSLDDYGAQLPSFMKQFKPLESLPYIPDLGRIEWAWHRAFHAPDQDPVNVAELLLLSDEEQLELCFKLNASLRVFHFDYPIAQIWRMNRGFIPEQEIDLDQGPEHLVVARKGYDTSVDTISSLESAFLSEIKKGLDVGTIYQNLLSKGSSEQLTSAFARILSSGWLVA